MKCIAFLSKSSLKCTLMAIRVTSTAQVKQAQWNIPVVLRPTTVSFLLLLKAAADEECKFDRYMLSFPTYKHLHGHLQYIR